LNKKLRLLSVFLLLLASFSPVVQAEASCTGSVRRWYSFRELAWGDMNSWADVDGNWVKDEQEIISPCILVSVTFGRGRVICIGDEGFLSNVLVNEADNLRLGLNIIAWLAEAEGNRHRVLFDSAHNEMQDIGSGDPWRGYSIFAGKLREAGYTVEKNTARITWRTIKRFDVLVINGANKKFLPTEILAIVSFVLNGGGLLLMGEWHMSSQQRVAETLNSIAHWFGVKFGKDTVCDMDNYWPEDHNVEAPQRYPAPFPAVTSLFAFGSRGLNGWIFSSNLGRKGMRQETG